MVAIVRLLIFILGVLCVVAEITRRKKFAEVWGRYRITRLSQWNRRWMRRFSIAPLLSFGGVAVTIGAAVSLIGISQAQLASSAASKDLFAYPWFDVGGFFLVAAIVLGAMAAACSGSQSRARKSSPFVIESDSNVYCTPPGDPRRLRIRVYNSEALDLTGVRLELLGGHPITTPDYLRVANDSSDDYSESRSGVPLVGYEHCYFEVVSVESNNQRMILGLINNSQATHNPLAIPTNNDNYTLIVKAEGRRATDGSFVRPAIATFQVMNYHGSVLLERAADLDLPYGRQTTPKEREGMP